MTKFFAPALVFDCFGVLYNDAFKEFVSAYGGEGESSPERLYQLVNGWDRGSYEDDYVYPYLSRISGLPDAEIKRRFHDTGKLNVALADELRALAPHYRLGLLSNAERQFLDEFLAASHTADLFEVVVASSETSFAKPEKGIFEITAERFGLPLDQLVFIDDSTANVAAAQSYGLRAHTYQSVPHLKAWLESELQ